MLPIGLAWAWTIWKAQGQIIQRKVVMSLGVKEGDNGLSYVAFRDQKSSRTLGFQEVFGRPSYHVRFQLKTTEIVS